MCEANNRDNNSNKEDKESNSKEYAVTCPYCKTVIESTVTNDIRSNPIIMECPKCHKEIVNTYAYLERYRLWKGGQEY